jgi:1-acyl-sn-glycerol-3-phosphate acyltransferase
VADWKYTPAKDAGLPEMARLRSERREAGLLEYSAQFLARCGVMTYLTLWHRVRVEHRHRLPRANPMVLVANHASHLDSVVLGGAVPWRIRRDLFPLAAGDVFFQTPVLTALAAYFINALPMWRKNVGRHALDALRARIIEERCGYILFPEGKRADDGVMVPFKAGIGMLVAGTDIPVVPCYIRGAYEAMPKHAKIHRPRQIRVIVGEPRAYAHIPNDKHGWRTITADLRAAVRELGGLPREAAGENEDPPGREAPEGGTNHG